MWLYKLMNKQTGKQYIGTSINPVSHRISRHAYAARTGRDSGMPISCAIRKYGIQAFTVQTLVQCPDYDYLLDLEAKAIVAFGTRTPDGYNLTAGGRGSRRPCSSETRALISAKAQGRIPWNKGKRSPATEWVHAHRGMKCGRKKGSIGWQAGKKLGPLPEHVKEKISQSVRRVRATRFWSSKKYDSQIGGI
jgi:group I intron endonuclease